MKRSKLLTIPLAATRMLLAILLLTMTAQTAGATETSTITVDGTDYTLFTGFTATAGTKTYANFVDGNTSTKWHVMKNMGENARDSIAKALSRNIIPRFSSSSICSCMVLEALFAIFHKMTRRQF